jgi:dihydroorotase
MKKPLQQKILIKNISTTPHLLGELDNENNHELVIINIAMAEGIITKISTESIEGDFDSEIDGRAMFLSPGLCDPQVHFREPGLEYKEDIESGSRAAVKGGFTAVISMPNTTPVADNYKTVKYMWDKQLEVGLCAVHPTGAVSIGLLGKECPNYPELKDAGAIALTDDGKGVQSDELFEQVMIEAAKLNLPVLDHSEDESLSNNGSIHLGEVSKSYGIAGIDANSEAVHVKRGCDLSEKTGAHYHVLHVSTSKSIEHVREAKRKGLKVTAEVSPHHLLLCDEDIPERADGSLNSNWKMNPPLRSKSDREACQKALTEGLIDAIATDHAPHAPAEKAMAIENAPFGIIGLETAFPLIYTNFVRSSMLTLNKCIDLMSKDAAALFGLEMGRILEGNKADLAVFDLDNEFQVDTDFFASKSENSPFIGSKLFGRTALTIYDGKIVYQDI